MIVFLIAAGLAAGILGVAVPAVAAPRAPVTLFAAASVEGPARLIARSFESARYDLSVIVRSEASSRLANDILGGGPVPDLFLSADGANVDRLVAAGFADPGTRVDLLANEIVVVGAAGVDADAAAESGGARASPATIAPLASLADLAGPTVRGVALCDSLVPLGGYARALLRAAGVWDAVAARAVLATDARAALAAVETGAAEYAIVYATQAENAKRVRVVWRAAPGAGPAVRYVLVLMRRSARRSDAIALRDFLVSDHAARVFARYGFRPLLPGPPHADSSGAR